MSDTTPQHQPQPLPPNPLEQEQHERSVLLRFLRGAFLVLMVTVAMLLIIQQSQTENRGQPSIGLAINWWPTLMATVAFFLLVLLFDFMTPNKRIAAISGVFLGVVTGVIRKY